MVPAGFRMTIPDEEFYFVYRVPQSVYVRFRPDWLKGKQVRFLYDLVTVIRECRFYFHMESHWCMALGRQNLYEDLSARKPANRLVQGNKFPDHE